MIFLKLHTLEGDEFTINMSRVDDFASDGAGHTKLWYDQEEFRHAKESYEDVNRMLDVALLGAKRVIALEDVGAFVR